MIPSTTHISSLMTHSPITVGCKVNLEEVRKIFNNQNIHHIPVVDEENYLKGVISITDYATALDAMTPFGNRQAKAANDRMLKAILAEDIMTKEVTTLQMDSYLETALAIFKENRFRCIPVLDHDKKLRGILTTYDIMIALINPANNASFSITHPPVQGSGLDNMQELHSNDKGPDGK